MERRQAASLPGERSEPCCDSDCRSGAFLRCPEATPRDQLENQDHRRRWRLPRALGAVPRRRGVKVKCPLERDGLAIGGEVKPRPWFIEVPCSLKLHWSWALRSKALAGAVDDEYLKSLPYGVHTAVS